MSGNRYTTNGSSREYMASESDHHVSAIKRVWHYNIAIMHRIHELSFCSQVWDCSGPDLNV